VSDLQSRLVNKSSMATEILVKTGYAEATEFSADANTSHVKAFSKGWDKGWGKSGGPGPDR